MSADRGPATTPAYLSTPAYLAPPALLSSFNVFPKTRPLTDLEIRGGRSPATRPYRFTGPYTYHCTYVLLTLRLTIMHTHRSPLTAHRSPLTTHHSLLATHHSPLTTHHSPLTTHHLPLTRTGRSTKRAQWVRTVRPQSAEARWSGSARPGTAQGVHSDLRVVRVVARLRVGLT